MPPGAVGVEAADIGQGILVAEFGGKEKHVVPVRVGIDGGQVLWEIGIGVIKMRSHAGDEERFGIVTRVCTLHIIGQ